MLVQAKGNAAFASGNFQEAIGHFTAAIDLDDRNHVLYSNRSACQVCLMLVESSIVGQHVSLLSGLWMFLLSRTDDWHHALNDSVT